MQASSLRRRRITGAHAFFLGALLALFALAPAILPYGGRFVTRGDFIEQQLPFILETRRILRGGLNSYSFNTFLGAPAVGSYAFYTLGSVFVWPLALLPKALIPFGISVMAVLKHAVCALTSFCCLRRMIRDERLALLGCVLYAFSGFTVVNMQFYHFTEVIAFFPLILLGMEDAMGERPRRGLLALFCGLNTLTNYYFMLSSALLAALYFVFRFFSADWKPRRTWQNVFALIFECGVGCALAGVLLCPAMLFMLSITRTGAGDTSLLTQTYTLGTLLERVRALLMPIESNVVHAYYGDAPSWASTAAYLPVFGLTGAVALFGQKKHRWLKGLLLALAGILLLVIALPVESGDGTAEKAYNTAQGEKETSGGSGRTASGDSGGTASGSQTSEEGEQEYVQYLEKKLENILMQMDGVGRVDVMITVSDGGEQIVEKDKKTTSSSTGERDSGGGERSVTEQIGRAHV